MWRTSRRIPIGVFRIERPALEAAALFSYGVFYVALAGITSMLVAAYPLPILGAHRFNHDLWYALFFKITMLGVVPIGVFFGMGYRPHNLFLEWRPTPVRIGGLFASFAIGACLYWEYLAEIIGAAHDMDRGAFATRAIVGAVLPLFTAALPEEIFYRGLLQCRMERVAGRAPAVIVSATLFAAFHVPSRYLLSDGGIEGQAGDLLSVIVGTGVPALIVGLIFSFIWDRYRSLPILVAAHWGVDVLPSMTSLLGVRF